MNWDKVSELKMKCEEKRRDEESQSPGFWRIRFFELRHSLCLFAVSCFLAAALNRPWYLLCKRFAGMKSIRNQRGGGTEIRGTPPSCERHDSGLHNKIKSFIKCFTDFPSFPPTSEASHGVQTAAPDWLKDSFFLISSLVLIIIYLCKNKQVNCDFTETKKEIKCKRTEDK